MRRPSSPTASFGVPFFASLLPRLGWAIAVLLSCVALPAQAAQLTLSWTDNSTNESGFRVERATGSGAFAEVATVGVNITSYADTSLAASTSYSFRVRAYNSAGNSAYSNTATATTAPASANTAPTIGDIVSQTIQAGGSTGALTVTIGDAETAAASLTLTAVSSNTALISNSAIVLGGSGASRTVAATPTSGQTGVATITVTVSDGELTATDTFSVTVNSVSGSQTITSASGFVNTAIAPAQSGAFTAEFDATPSATALDGLIGLTAATASAYSQFAVTVRFSTGGAIDLRNGATYTAAQTVTYTPGVTYHFRLVVDVAAHTYSAYVTPAGGAEVLLGSNYAFRTEQNAISSIANWSGRVEGTGSLTVGTVSVSSTATNTAPTISNITNLTINQGTNSGAIAFTVGDAQTATASLTLAGSSSNTVLVPTNAIVFGGSGANRTVTVTPATGQSGTATVTVTVSDGALTAADTFVVTVSDTTGGATISAHPQTSSFTPGQTLALSVTAQGSGTLTYQWYFNGVAIVGATSATYSVPFAQAYHAGSYRVVVTSGGVAVSSNLATQTAATVAATGVRFANLSARASVRTGDNILINGFVVSGTGTKQVLLRAVGPTLSTFGVAGVLPDPTILLKRWNGSAYVDVATNSNWNLASNSALIRQKMTELGAFGLPENSLDAAILVDLAPGTYSLLAADTVSRMGIAIVEVYDAETTAGTARLANISNRGYVGTGADALITGFVVTAEGSKTLLIRAVGPTLGSVFGMTGALSDPVVELTRSEQGVTSTVLTSDNWGENGDEVMIQQAAAQIGAFTLASGTKDAAVVVTLPPGAYTIVTRGVGSASGTAIVELYELP